jgi:hypothetical protein
MEHSGGNATELRLEFPSASRNGRPPFFTRQQGDGSFGRFESWRDFGAKVSAICS